MVEYVGIPYTDIVKHAFLPAAISYVALFYIVHLEALKLGLEATASQRERSISQKMVRWGLGLSGTIVVLALIYWIAMGAQVLFGAAAPWIVGGLLLALHVALLRIAARYPDLPDSIDVDNPVLPDTWPTVRAGLHFLIPIGTLIWCLMIEEMSPALSAFWATMALIALMLTQRPLIALFRGNGRLGEAFTAGWREVVGGLNDGARNMIGIGIATGTAGIIVGHHADRARLPDDRLRRGGVAGQRVHHAALHRLRVPGPGHRGAHHRELHPGRVADGAGDRGTGRAERPGDPADRRAPVRLLLRDHG
jgi:TRAP-type uncharacterized transport system fused permease subunit